MAAVTAELGLERYTPKGRAWKSHPGGEEQWVFGSRPEAVSGEKSGERREGRGGEVGSEPGCPPQGCAPCPVSTAEFFGF